MYGSITEPSTRLANILKSLKEKSLRQRMLPNAARRTTPIRNRELMSHQNEPGNGTESAGLTKPDDGDDCLQKEGENVRA